MYWSYFTSQQLSLHHLLIHILVDGRSEVLQFILHSFTNLCLASLSNRTPAPSPDNVKLEHVWVSVWVTEVQGLWGGTRLVKCAMFATKVGCLVGQGGSTWLLIHVTFALIWPRSHSHLLLQMLWHKTVSTSGSELCWNHTAQWGVRACEITKERTGRCVHR